jgi:pimeloyl-ACP methyl ester carboxylesterase
MLVLENFSMTRLVALHGMTLNGATMQRQLGPLRSKLEQLADIDWLDAPHKCPEDSVQRNYDSWGMPIPDGPHLRWWDASEDGTQYAGWEQTRDLLAERLAGDAPTIVFGFSQGAIVATAAVTLSVCGMLPPIAGAILMAGLPPRARSITRHYRAPLELPSLHVWGTQDRVIGEGPERLAEWFAPRRRQVVTWEGAHSIPRRGPVGERILSFVRSFE